MINTSSGEITIGNTIVGPGHSKEDFLASNLYLDILWSKNEGKFYWYFLNPQKLGEYFFIVSLYFNEKGIIVMIGLGLTKDGSIPEWKDWSLENEMERKKLQDRWLLKLIGPPHKGNEWYGLYEYEWGTIKSRFNERDGSSIEILYTESEYDQ
jgi:hypothetical protein